MENLEHLHPDSLDKEITQYEIDHMIHDAVSLERREPIRTAPIPTDELTCATYGLSYLISRFNNFLLRINNKLDNWRYATENAKEVDYRRLERLPNYDLMTPKQRFEAIKEIIRDREHLSKQ